MKLVPRLAAYPFAAMLLCASPHLAVVRAQDNPLPNSPVSPVPQTGNPSPAKSSPVMGIARLTADNVRYEGGVVIAEAGEHPVRLESATVSLTAQKVWLDIENRKVSASGEVLVERQIVAERRVLQNKELRERYRSEPFVETLRGENFVYDFGAGMGRVDDIVLRLEDFDIQAESLTINGQIYTAHNVIVRPGGLTDEERRIYGTPPFNLRVSRLTLDAHREDGPASLAASGAGLYFKNTKILPVPSYVFRAARIGGQREDKAFTLSPRISTNSSDRFLLTTQLEFPYDRRHPERLSLTADIGLSARVGFRGGLQLSTRSKYGALRLLGRVNDVVVTQLTNRIELNREPELVYDSPTIPLFPLPGGRRAGVYLNAGTGRFEERQTGINGSDVRSVRHQATIGLTTRVVDVDGPYLDLFARTSSYPTLDRSYRNAGFEIGYIGSISPYLRGQFSYSNISLSGSTPFRFDQVEIARELRTTFDIQLSPRYIVPVDLRYDLDLNDFRDERIGLLRSYKTFAYGITYQTARRELKLDFRQGF